MSKPTPPLPQPEHSALRTHRSLAGLTLERVAFALDLKDAAPVSRWERGVRTPDLIWAFALSRFYKTYPEHLFPNLWHRAAGRVLRDVEEEQQRVKAIARRR